METFKNLLTAVHKVTLDPPPTHVKEEGGGPKQHHFQKRILKDIFIEAQLGKVINSPVNTMKISCIG